MLELFVTLLEINTGRAKAVGFRPESFLLSDRVLSLGNV